MVAYFVITGIMFGVFVITFIVNFVMWKNATVASKSRGYVSDYDAGSIERHRYYALLSGLLCFSSLLLIWPVVGLGIIAWIIFHELRETPPVKEK